MKLDTHDIRFEEETHTYFVDGLIYPSVSQILAPLNDFSQVDKDVLERSKLFGQAVHKMVELDVLGTLDEDSIDKSLMPYFHQFRDFRALVNFDTRNAQVERVVIDHKLKYAGRLDILAPIHDRPALIDIKTGARIPRTVGPQTWAYKNALGTKVDRYCLHLRSDDWALTELKNDDEDASIFLSCYNIYNFRRKK